MEEIIPLTGSMDLDTSKDVLKKGNYIDARNITSVSKDGNRSGTKTTIPGNQPFPLGDYVLPAGNNIVIGTFVDAIKNRVIDFLYNDSGSCQIREWDFNTKTVSVILSDGTDQTLNTAILDFDPNRKITGVNIIHRSDAEGDLLFWTDPRVREINIDRCKAAQGDYESLDPTDILLVKQPPLFPLTGGYSNDSTHPANNLRSKLFQFSYRFIYDDYSPSTYGPWSSLFLPTGSVDPSIDTNQSNNNVINLSLSGVNNMVDKIEVIARVSVGPNLWADPVRIAVVDAVVGQSDYSLKFYNDGTYPPADPAEVALTFSFVPDEADAQELANGNVLVYGAILEGRNYSDVTLDVTMAAGLEDGYDDTGTNNIALTTGDFVVTFDHDGDEDIKYTVTYIGQSPLVGTANVVVYSKFRMHNGVFHGTDWYSDTIPFQLTEQTTSVTIKKRYARTILYSSVTVSIQSASGYRVDTSGRFFSISKYDWWEHIQFGLVYFDENGKTNTAYTDAGMSLYMPAYNVRQGAGTITQVPYITASINNTPPDWAASYAWVRSLNLSESYFLYWRATNVESDDRFVYVDITNLAFNYNNVNPSTNYKYDFVPGDMLRMLYYDNVPESSPLAYENKEFAIIGVIDNPKAGSGDYVTGFNITNPGHNYTSAPTVTITGGGGNGATAHAIILNGQVVSIILDTQGQGYTSAPDVALTGGGGTEAAAEAIVGYFQGTFIKFNKDDAEYPDGPCTIKVYRPQQTVNTENTIFYEFGQTYPILMDATGKKYHGGMLQNQTQNQPATFKFTEGDAYFTMENIPASLTETPTPFYEVPLMSMNYDDNFQSGQNSNGRAFAVFENAVRAYYPTLYRWSGSYLQDTEVNKLSLFTDANQDELNRSYGAIRRFTFRQNFLRVFQELKVGRIPVGQAIVQTAAGNDILSQSERLFNPVSYNESAFGIGDAPESLTSQNFADYFVDTNRGILCRASQDGVDPVSVLYGANSLFASRGPMFNAAYLKSTSNNPQTPNAQTPFILGIFDTFRNEYVCLMRALDRWQNGVQIVNIPYTSIGFNEGDNGFECFYDLYPEWAACLNNLIVSFKDGVLYTHDNPQQCNFFGVQYDSYIEPVMNENLPNDKSYISIKESANAVWWADSIKTNLGQSSFIPASSFKLLEGNASASFYRDTNSQGGLANGTPLKGKWLTPRLRVTPGDKTLYITAVSLKYNVYP